MAAKNLTIVNFTIVTYFVLIYLINLYKLDFVLIGVFRELLSIPFLIAQIIFFIIGFRFLIKGKKRHYLATISIVVLAICMIITIGSFF